MQQRDVEREPARCACGREVTSASRHLYRSSSGVYEYRRCECGQEWTDRVASVDHTSPVTSDEVLEVHERLVAFGGSIADLIGQAQA